MKKTDLSRRSALTSLGALSFAITVPAYAASGSAIGATIDTGSVGAPISPFIYGGFIEHIADLINDSLWSEVLDDRKFYWPVVKPEPAPVAAGGRRRSPARKWHPTGSDETVSMDTKGAYVGAHSPVIHLGGDNALGIFQSGLGLGKQAYTGRVVVAADPGVAVTATLIWGDDPAQRQSVSIATSGDWATVPLAFNCGAATLDGRLEITGTGTGSFRIGAVSLMPANNIAGFRPDVIARLREMDCKIMRMPGGNFISAYDWHFTIGDRDKRPPILDPVWNFAQPNDVGIDELLHMAQLIKAEPYWCISTGFDSPRSGAEIVEYINGAATTEWGAKRAANGHPEPWGVKYWDVGNEMYGHWQMGHIAPEQYYVKHNLFVDAMRAVDPTIYIAAPGGFADEMTTGQGIFIEGQPQVAIGSERDWAYGMLKNCMGRFDALQTHAYPPENKHYDLSTGKLVDIQPSLNEWSRGMAQRIQTMADCWDAYKKAFPVLNDGKIKVFFDEWAYHFGADYKGCLAIASGFHEFFRHTDFIEAAGYTMATGWLDISPTDSVISATGRVFQLYNQHFGVIPVAVTGTSPVPPPKYPIGGDQPSVNTGSATWPVDVSAALTADRKSLIVSVVNANEAVQTLKMTINGASPAKSGRTWRLAAPGLDAQNKVGAAPQVTIQEGQFNPRAGTLTLPATSITLFEYKLA
jgi:alpha-N-arabinofuranosidase